MRKIKITKKVREKIYVLILIIGILLVFGVLYFLFIEDMVASEELTDKQVKNGLEMISELNQNLDYNKVNISVPWIVFGIYQGKELAMGYSCSDVCHENGRYQLIYSLVGSEEECNEIGGKILYDSSLGKQFTGCEPIVD